MLTFPQFLFCLTGVLILGIIQACNDNYIYPKGGPYYYGDFATYKIPFQPVERITPEEAKARMAYCVAYFDEDHRVISFTKYLKENVQFSAKYFYNLNGIVEKSELTKSNGEVNIQYFDKKGQLISSNSKDTYEHRSDREENPDKNKPVDGK